MGARTREQNLALIRRFWQDLYRRDFDAVGAYFAEDGLYQDVPTPDFGALGPRQVAARLRLGLEPIERYVHHEERMVCDGDTVITEHREEWHFHTGEVVTLPFVSIHEIGDDGKLRLWRDYWDLGTLLGRAPKWWLERLAAADASQWGRKQP